MPNDIAALERLITATAEDAVNAQRELARLKFQLARCRRAERSSQKLARETEQLEPAIETLESDQAERLATASPEATTGVASAVEA